jgi:carboxymethylenebutenolidase
LPLPCPDGEKPRDLHLSRRALGAMILAAAALPAATARAQAAIHTSDAGLVAGMVAIPTGGRPLPAYVARPDARGAFPAIIVVSEAFGLHDYIRDVCRRLARQGYVAIAPDYFFRAGDPSRLTDAAAIQRIGEAATNAQVMKDTGATLDWLRAQRFATRNVGITGFSWGGAVVWMACDRFPELRAGVAWYGRLIKPESGFLADEPRLWPIEIAPRLRTPVLGLYAGRDQGIRQDEIDTMREVLRRARRSDSSLFVYPEAQHGFHADYRATYHAAYANDGWARMLDHFARHGLRPGRIGR